MNIGCLFEHIFEEDLIYLIGYWRIKERFCDNIKKLKLDSGMEFVVFQNCTLESLMPIFIRCPYLTLIPNEGEESYIHGGEDLDINFLFLINWTYEL